MSYSNFLSPQGAWSNTTKYSVVNVAGQAAIGIYIISCPSVTHLGITYVALGPTQPTLGTVPASDTAWTPFGDVASGVLATPLTGFVSTAGVPTAASTILQAIQNLSFRSYGYIYNLAVASVLSGNQALTSSLNSLSSDITIATPAINLPLNKKFAVTIRLDVTTASASGATFSIAATNCTVVVQPIAVGASVTAGYITVTGIVTTTSTASPSIALSASSVTGTVAINNDSTILIQQI